MREMSIATRSPGNAADSCADDADDDDIMNDEDRTIFNMLEHKHGFHKVANCRCLSLHLGDLCSAQLQNLKYE